MHIAQNIIDDQQAKLAALKSRVNEAKHTKPDRDFIRFKIVSLMDHIETLNESIHYARQETDAYQADAVIDGRYTTAKVILDNLERELYEAKKQLSEWQAM